MASSSDVLRWANSIPLARIPSRDRRAEAIGVAALRVLRQQAMRNHAAGEALSAEIRAIMTAHSGSERLTAKRIQVLLTRDPRPSVRRIQEHMAKIKSAESSAPR
jgi:hypothetical protein